MLVPLGEISFQLSSVVRYIDKLASVILPEGGGPDSKSDTGVEVDSVIELKSDSEASYS